MRRMETQKLVGALQDSNAVQYSEFELTQGGTSDYYIDKYFFETGPRCLKLITEGLC